NFPKIDAWRSQKAIEHTRNIRPDLLENSEEN
ncbi:MAG: tRNA (guanine37-N1)-methyltransferase, partial [Flavobacteriales bacterium]